MSVKNLLESINSYPDYAKKALDNVYRGKVFAVGLSSGHIDGFFKTKKGAEGYIKRQQRVTYYSDYSSELTTCGSGLFIEEISAEQIEDPKTSKKLWYNTLKSNHGRDYLYSNIIHQAKYIGVSEEIMQYITESIEDMKNYRGLTVLDEFEEVEPVEVESIEEIAIVTEEPEQIETLINTNNIEVSYKLNEEFNGIEVYFTNKPAQEIIETLKSNGFRWSKRGFWYAKQSEDRLNLVKNLCNTSEPMEQTEAVYNYPEIDIDDIHTYTVDEKLQKAENDANWIFRKNERDQTKEIQEYFQHYQNQVLDIISKTNNERIIYYIKKDLQRFKKAYYNNFISRLRNKANNPSWLVTGRDGRNASRDRKYSDRYDNLMRESTQLQKDIENAIDKAYNAIGRDKERKLQDQIQKQNVTIDFKTESKVVTVAGYTEKVRAYVHGEYFICKTWGCFRIFKNGHEIHSMKTTQKLDDAKKYVTMKVFEDQQQTA